jgi:hypothetical protein
MPSNPTAPAEGRTSLRSGWNDDDFAARYEWLESHSRLKAPSDVALTIALEALAASASETPAPTAPERDKVAALWYCESCEGLAPCDIVDGEVVCQHKHIVATFDSHSRAAPPAAPAPTREQVEALPRYAIPWGTTQSEIVQGGMQGEQAAFAEAVLLTDVLQLHAAAPAAPEARLTPERIAEAKDYIDRVSLHRENHDTIVAALERAALAATPPQPTREQVLDVITSSFNTVEELADQIVALYAKARNT